MLVINGTLYHITEYSRYYRTAYGTEEHWVAKRPGVPARSIRVVFHTERDGVTLYREGRALPVFVCPD